MSECLLLFFLMREHTQFIKNNKGVYRREVNDKSNRLGQLWFSLVDLLFVSLAKRGVSEKPQH
jgi:hypothetical protein